MLYSSGASHCPIGRCGAKYNTSSAPLGVLNARRANVSIAAKCVGAGSSGQDQGKDDQLPRDFSSLPPGMLAAMAMSPIAAISLPLVNDPKWRASAEEFAANLRWEIKTRTDSDAFRDWVKGVDQSITYMDWSYPFMGIDLTYMWDPELWVKFKQAVWYDKPQFFWNELMDRIEYKSVIPQAGIVGDMRISYSKFLHLLENDRIKRVVVYGDMKTAIVEVPHPWYASIMGAPGVYPWLEDSLGRPINLLIPNPDAPDDPNQWYCPEMPEWDMEKYRFYVDLPGDFWDKGVMVQYLRSKDVRIMWDKQNREYVVPQDSFTKVFKVKTELQMLDPTDNWDFLGWLTQENKMDFYEKSAAFCVFGRGLTLVLAFLAGTPVFKIWRSRKNKKKKKEESTWQRLTASRAKEFMTKDKKTGKLKDTGVRFTDIAGLDHIVVEMKEVVKMLLNDPQYKKVGAKCPRGIIFQGPPGTGKTYLARAIAGEAGVTFFSAVGSEFVEMFAGVAAARVNNLFSTARKRSPAIIFIDEIDAIGRARAAGGGDPGSIERESALLAMLVQMDGIHGKLESVLTIGATNLAQELDQALLRPGRFEVVYEIPSPGPVARLEILRYHAKNKAMESENVLAKVAEVTQGWSAAALANLLNEGAILTVRRSIPKVTQGLLLELVEGLNWGEKTPKIPNSEAKNRLALVTAAKAVALATTPGLDPITMVSMWNQRKGLGPSIEFLASEDNLDPNWHPEMVDIMDFARNVKVNAATIGDQRLGEFFHCASLLIPLYAPRATELAFFGSEAVSLATAAPISDCFEIAYYCVRNSVLHPRFRGLPPLHTMIWLGENENAHNQRDPLNLGLEMQLGYHKLTLTLLKAAWKRATKLVMERRTTIIKVAEELLAADTEKISGERLVEIIETTPLDSSSDIQIQSDFLPILKEVLGRVPKVLAEAAEAAEVDAEAASTLPTTESEAPQEEAALLQEEASPVAPQKESAPFASFRTEDGAGRMGQTSFSPMVTTPLVVSASTEPSPVVSEPCMASFRTEDGAGRMGQTSFSPMVITPLVVSASTEPTPVVSGPCMASFRSGFGAGYVGQTSFTRAALPSVPPEPSASKDATTSEGTKEPPLSAAAAAEASRKTLLQLDDDTLASVSRAIMGRLDIVDLIGENTAYEVAEKVREALLDPETVERLMAVRRFVEDDTAEFPPAPLESAVSGPLYGQINGNLSFWMRRQVNTITTTAVDLLMSERELAAYSEDMDIPRNGEAARKKVKAAAEKKPKQDA